MSPKFITSSLNERLPIRYNISILLIFSIIIAVLVAIVSAIGIKWQQDIYQTKSLIYTFVPNDIINLFIGLPFMLISLLLTRRGKIVGYYFRGDRTLFSK